MRFSLGTTIHPVEGAEKQVKRSLFHGLYCLCFERHAGPGTRRSLRKRASHLTIEKGRARSGRFCLHSRAGRGIQDRKFIRSVQLHGLMGTYRRAGRFGATGATARAKVRASASASSGLARPRFCISCLASITSLLERWPIAGAAHCSRSATRCCRYLRRPRPGRPRHPTSGSARTAKDRCV